MERIPDEVLTTNILSRLPVKTISQFRCVSKAWCNLFKTPFFVKQHLKLAIENNHTGLLVDARDDSNPCILGNSILSLDIDSLISNENTPVKHLDPNLCGFCDIWGSCNGLVCVLGRSIQSDDYVLRVYNPSTTEYNKIPTPGDLVFTLLSAYGFGYDSKVEDYKLVVMMNVPSGASVGVYTLGTNSWRDLKNTIPFRPLSGRHGVLVNETIHWLAVSWGTHITYHWVILCFYLGNETIQQLPLPEPVSEYTEVRICCFEGSLCLIVNKDQVHQDIWVKKDYGDFWTKLFTISSEPTICGELIFVPLKSFKNGKILMLRKDNNSLVLYYPECKSVRALNVYGISKVWSAETFVKSLVSSVSSGTEIHDISEPT